MLKTNTSGFKAKLGKYMRAVRAGQEVIVTDRDRPVARLSPFEAAKDSRLLITEVETDAPSLGTLQVIPIAYSGTDTLEMLKEDRSRR